MTAWRNNLLYLLLIVAVPASVAAGWWYYWPVYQVHRAEQAAAAGDWPQVEELSKLLANASPPNARAKLLYGQALRHLERLPEAEAMLLQASRVGADAKQVRRELALTRAALRYSTVVERYLLECLKDDPNDVEVLTALGKGNAESLHWDEADRYFSRALELRPDDIDLRLMRGHMRLTAASSYNHGRAADAANDFMEILRRDPNAFDAKLYLSHCLLADAKVKEARTLLRDIRRQAPDRIEPLIGLASCALEESDWDEADRLLRAALKIDPESAYAITMQGDLALRRERYEEAVGYYRRVLALDKSNAQVHLKLAQALRALKRTGEADAAMREYERLTRGSGAAPVGGVSGPR